jgi:hypothetical protein
MLTIKNKENLNDAMVLSHTTDGYYVEGVYEYPDHYQINIHSTNNTFTKGDEILILQRYKVQNQNNHTYNYYTLYNMLEPQRRLNVTKQMIGFKDMFLHSIETILKMKN